MGFIQKTLIASSMLYLLSYNNIYNLKDSFSHSTKTILKKETYSDICRPIHTLESLLKQRERIIKNCEYVIDISLNNHTLDFYNQGILQAQEKIATPVKKGDKIRNGDGKIKYGAFFLYQFEWKESKDFGYGFIRIDFSKLGFYGFGLHGTNKEHLLGKNVSKGCIRAKDSLVKLILKTTRKDLSKTLILIKP